MASPSSSFFFLACFPLPSSGREEKEKKKRREKKKRGDFDWLFISFFFSSFLKKKSLFLPSFSFIF